MQKRVEVWTCDNCGRETSVEINRGNNSDPPGFVGIIITPAGSPNYDCNELPRYHLCGPCVGNIGARGLSGNFVFKDLTSGP